MRLRQEVRGRRACRPPRGAAQPWQRPNGSAWAMQPERPPAPPSPGDRRPGKWLCMYASSGLALVQLEEITQENARLETENLAIKGFLSRSGVVSESGARSTEWGAMRNTRERVRGCVGEAGRAWVEERAFAAARGTSSTLPASRPAPGASAERRTRMAVTTWP